MRPNRTPSPALWLALLAAISGAGCVGGELESDWGAAVDALVEEVEGGIWAGGGNPLADGGFDFTCDATGEDWFGECSKKCWSHGP